MKENGENSFYVINMENLWQSPVISGSPNFPLSLHLHPFDGQNPVSATCYAQKDVENDAQIAYVALQLHVIAVDS